MDIGETASPVNVLLQSSPDGTGSLEEGEPFMRQSYDWFYEHSKCHENGTLNLNMGWRKGGVWANLTLCDDYQVAFVGSNNAGHAWHTIHNHNYDGFLVMASFMLKQRLGKVKPWHPPGFEMNPQFYYSDCVSFLQMTETQGGIFLRWPLVSPYNNNTDDYYDVSLLGDNGSSEIVGYEILFRSKASFVQEMMDTTWRSINVVDAFTNKYKIHFESLVDDYEYEFRVRAINSLGITVATDFISYHYIDTSHDLMPSK